MPIEIENSRLFNLQAQVVGELGVVITSSLCVKRKLKQLFVAHVGERGVGLLVYSAEFLLPLCNDSNLYARCYGNEYYIANRHPSALSIISHYPEF
jgi:hypothetical protein